MMEWHELYDIVAGSFGEDGDATGDWEVWAERLALKAWQSGEDAIDEALRLEG